MAVLPVVKSLESMLIGIVAIRNGVLKLFSIDNDEDDVSVADDVRLAKLWGDARLCRAWGIPKISCGPDDMSVSTSVPVDVPEPGRSRRSVPPVHPGWWFAAVW